MGMGKYPHPEEMMNFTENEKMNQRLSAQKLIERVTEAYKGGESEVYVEDGYYRFGSAEAPLFNLCNMENFRVIGGDGVNFIQETTGTVIKLKDCKNVTVKGVKVDYADMKFIQCTITKFSDVGEPIVRIDDNYKGFFEKFKDRLAGNRLVYFDSNDLTREIVTSNTRGFLRELVEIGNGEYQVTYRDQNTLRLTPLIDIKAGDKLVMFSRGGDHAIAVEGCECITIEDVDVYASGAFGLSEHSCIGGNVFRRLRMIRRPDTDRLMCASRDGFHSQNVKIGALIEECEFSYAEDDLLNVHCFNGVVTKKYSDTEYEVTFPLPTYLDDNTHMAFIKNGAINEAVAVSAERIADPDQVEKYSSMDKIILEATGRHIRTFNLPFIYRVKLNRAVEADIYGEVTSAGYSSAGLIVRNCYFHDSHCMGCIVTGPDATVENCRFERNSGTGVSLVRGGFWSEGPYPTKIVVRNNVFKEHNGAFEAQYRPGVITVQCETKGLVHDISIENNVFENNWVGALFAKNVANIRFEGNKVDGYLDREPYHEGVEIAKYNGDAESFCGVYFDGCDDVTYKNNALSGMGKYAQADLRITDTCTNIKL